MRRYHHIGIPTDVVREGEVHLAEYGLYVSGLEESSYGVEWMRFDADSPLPEVVRTTAHVAFQVDDLDLELKGREILIQPNSPSPGVRVAFIIENGAPVELMEIDPTSPYSLQGGEKNDLA
jgi:hypothetical protein